MRHDGLYLSDIVEAAAHVAEFIAGVDFQTFEESELLRSAVAQKLAIIGEAAARVSDELKNRHPEIPWPHAYFGIDWDIVWRSAKNRCPILREQVAGILRTESSGADAEP